MKKNIMSILTASSVVLMATGATLAAYAEPDAGEIPYVRDEAGNFDFYRDSGNLTIFKNEGFTKWQEKEFAITKESVKSIEFGQDVTEIPKDAFADLPNLEAVNFYSGYDGTTNIEKIGENAFKGCKALVNINFPTSFYEPKHDEQDNLLNQFVIGKGAFQDCTALEYLSFSGMVVTEIGESAFEGCKNLKSIDFGQYNDKLRIIGDRAFYGCDLIESLTLSEKLEKIGSRAFANCKSLYHLDMSYCSNLELIDELAFFNCVSLRIINFPNDGTSDSYSWNVPPKHTIKKWAFRNCPWLDGIILSADVGTVEKDAFLHCKNLKYIGYNQSAEGADISVPEGVTLFSFDKLEPDEIIEIIGEEPQRPVEDYNIYGTYEEYQKDLLQYWEDCNNWYSKVGVKSYQITVKNQPQTEDGKIFLPEKFGSDADILKIIDFDGTEHKIDLPRHADIKNNNTYYWYDFSQIPEQYNMIVNVNAANPIVPTARSEEELYDRRKVEGADVEWDPTSKSYVPHINDGTMEDDPVIPWTSLIPATPTSDDSSDSSSVPSTPSTPTPPPYVPPYNYDDPPESDPESSDPESSDPESSEPESSEPESSEPESSEPESSEPESSEPESSNPISSEPIVSSHTPSESVPGGNPNTGVTFMVPVVIAGAAFIVVVSKRNKM